MSVDSIKQVAPQQYLQQQAVASQTRRDSNLSNIENGSGKKTVSTSNEAASGVTVELTNSTPLKNLDTVRVIEQMHARLNELAKGVRETNEALAQSSKLLAQANNSVQTIIKNYPPYSIDSLERRDILMSYISIRKEIQQMMVPPPPTPIYEKIAHMWDQLFSESNQLNSNIVPDLDPTSSDATLNSAATALGTANDQVAALSTGITDALVLR